MANQLLACLINMLHRCLRMSILNNTKLLVLELRQALSGELLALDQCLVPSLIVLLMVRVARHQIGVED